MDFKYLKHIFLWLIVLFFIFIVFISKVNWFSVDKIDINKDNDFYLSLDKTWSLLELKIELNAVKNWKIWLDVFYKLENVLIEKIRNNKSKINKKDDKFFILLYFVQRSIENLQKDVLWEKSRYKIKILDKMFDKLYQEMDGIPNQNTRGIWFWSNANFDWWSFNVIWNSYKEDVVIDDFKKYKISRVYGSYGRSISIDENQVGEWNVKLHDVWIKSDLLIWSSFLSVINNKDDFFLNIQNHFLDFNESRWNKDERLDDIHLDIEPHGMDNRWELSLSKKKWYLYDLLDLYKDLRTYLDDNNWEYVDIYVDLPHWFSNINSIGWDNQKERDNWFLEVGENVKWITLMTYENTKFDTILRWAEDETNLLWEKIRLSFDIDVGINKTWDSLEEYFDMIKEIENNTDYAVDIHHYSDLR